MARAISGNEVSVAKELGKAALKIASVVSPAVMAARGALAITRYLFKDNNDKPLDDKQITALTKKMTARIKKGDSTAVRLLDRFQKAVADQNWALARQLSGKQVEKNYLRLWKKAEQSRLGKIALFAVGGASLVAASYITDLLRGTNRNKKPMDKKEIDAALKRMKPLAEKSAKARKVLMRFQEAVENEDWKTARMLSGNKLEAAIVKDIKSTVKWARSIGTLG